MIFAKIIDKLSKKYHVTQMVSVKNVVTGIAYYESWRHLL